MEIKSLELLNKVQEDLRVGPAHISLMAAILQLREEQCDHLYIMTIGKRLQRVAHIDSKSTYYKYIADLHRFGYIEYSPTHYGKRESRIRILHI